jgi:hypothetical protein
MAIAPETFSLPTSKVDAHKVSGALFEINTQAARLAELLEDAEEITPEAEATMAEIMIEGPEQIEAAVTLVHELEAKTDANKYEARRYSERATAFAKQVDSIKAQLKVAIDKAFGGKLKTDKVTVWNQTTKTESVELREDATLSALQVNFPSLVVERLSLDKVAVKDALKTGKIQALALTDYIEVTHNESRSVRIK